MVRVKKTLYRWAKRLEANRLGGNFLVAKRLGVRNFHVSKWPVTVFIHVHKLPVLIWDTCENID